MGTPDNYSKQESGLTVTNTYVIPKIELTATKQWVNGPSVKPTIELQLYRNLTGSTTKQAEGTAVTLTNGKTSYTWKNLDKTDINGVVYQYSADEVNVPDNYEMTVSDDGLTITNPYVIPKVDVVARKVWVGGIPVDIELQLFRDGQPMGEVVILSKDETSYSWTDLDATDEDGVSYIYTVDEVTVPEGYEKSISEDGLTITNTYTRDILPSTGMGNEVKYAGYDMVMLGLAFTLLKKIRKEEE